MLAAINNPQIASAIVGVVCIVAVIILKKIGK